MIAVFKLGYNSSSRPLFCVRMTMYWSSSIISYYSVSSHRSLLSKEGRYSSIQILWNFGVGYKMHSLKLCTKPLIVIIQKTHKKKTRAQDMTLAAILRRREKIF
ncbi:unnamed protein product [Brassica napus]|uniref:(rape) hypothetical protein n=1 Tax=Brassica napus TaxID=3708 RepID=A0A816V4B2_BRANA|nr:unnamed protein product [Brassica napus]